jgi:LemA protein
LLDSKHDAWGALETQIIKRQELAARVVELCAKAMPQEGEVLERAGSAGNAVRAATRGASVTALAAADKSHRSAMAMLFARAGACPPLAASPAFAALVERIATLDARVDERREQYNAAVSVLNFRCDAFPYSLVARAMHLRPEALLP